MGETEAQSGCCSEESRSVSLTPPVLRMQLHPRIERPTVLGGIRTPTWEAWRLSWGRDVKLSFTSCLPVVQPQRPPTLHAGKGALTLVGPCGDNAITPFHKCRHRGQSWCALLYRTPQ